MGLESSNSRMANLARQEMYFHQFFTVEEIIARIDAVDAAQVQIMAQRLFDPDRIAVTLLGRLNGVKLNRSSSCAEMRGVRTPLPTHAPHSLFALRPACPASSFHLPFERPISLLRLYVVAFCRWAVTTGLLHEPRESHELQVFDLCSHRPQEHCQALQRTA